MELEFLGTGTSQGVPVIACHCAVCQSDDPRDKRLRTSVLMRVGGQVFAIDTGPDFRQQMLRAGVDDLDAVLYTHDHKDHIAGMDDVRAYNYKQKRDMDLYGSAQVGLALKREFYYAFETHKYPGVPNVNFHEIDNKAFKIGGVLITPIKVWHYKMPVFGFRVGDVSYLTDAKAIDPEEKDKIRGSKVLVVNALRKESHLSHFNLAEALALIEELKVEKAYLIHMSHLMGKHADVARELPSHVSFAYDGLKIQC